jgi:hypothetical protein
VKTTCWILTSLILLALGFVACGDGPSYTCPDPMKPCGYPDAGPDADMAD